MHRLFLLPADSSLGGYKPATFFFPTGYAQALSQLLFPRGLYKAEETVLWGKADTRVNDYQLKQNTCLHVAIIRGSSLTSAGPPARCLEGFLQAVQFTKYKSIHIKAFLY